MNRIRKNIRISNVNTLIVVLIGIVLVVSVGLVLRRLRVSSAIAIESEARSDYPVDVNDNTIIDEGPIDSGIQLGSSASVGDTSLEGSNFRIEGDFLVADICYDLPSQEDWLLSRNTSLVLKDQTIVVFEWGLIDWKYSDSGERIQRCDDVNFWIQGVDNIAEFQIVVPRLETSWPSQLNCEEAQRKLDANNTGIQIECVQTESSYGPEVISKPESLSAEAVQILVEEAFIEVLEGPWILTGSLP